MESTEKILSQTIRRVKHETKKRKLGRPPKPKRKRGTTKKATGEKRGPYFKSSLPTLNECKVYRNLRIVDVRSAETIGRETGFTKTTTLKLLAKLESRGAIRQDPLPNVWIDKLDTIQQGKVSPRVIERANPQYRKNKLWGDEIDLVNDLGNIVSRMPRYETWANKNREQLIRHYFAIGLGNVAPARNKKPIFTKAKWVAKTTEERLRDMLAHDDWNVGMWITDHVIFDFDEAPVMPDYDTLMTKSPHGYHAYFWRTPETQMIYGLPRVGKQISLQQDQHHLFYSPDQLPLWCRANIDTRALGDFIMLPPSRGYTWAKLRSPAHLPHYNTELLEVWKHRWQWSDLIRPEGKFELPDVIPEGIRQEMLFRFGRSLRGKRKSPGVIDRELRLCNQERCKPPIDQKELERTIKWVWEYKDRKSN
jgi:hypothetical protein